MINRRNFLKIFPLGAAGGLTGCGSLSGGMEPYPTPSIVGGGRVLFGIDRLEQDGCAVLRGMRVGLICNHTSVNASGVASRRVLQRALGSGFTALYGPEHGIDGRAKAGVKVGSSVDGVTGLPVYSLYGSTRKPTPQMLANVDALVFDLQDIGCRSYTYISTMALAMEACAQAGKRFMVLDRPNPLGGWRVQGPPLERRWKSFVGQIPVPYVHGMTAGELAKMIAARGWISSAPKLMVVPMQGWSRNQSWSALGRRWVGPSPNIPNAHSPFYYVATGMLGGLSGVDIGIGTSKPFQYAGGPGIDPNAFANYLNGLGMPGVRFRPYVSGKKAGYAGAELSIDANGQTDLCALGVLLCAEVVRRTGGAPLRATSGGGRDLFHKVYGSESLWADLSRGTDASTIAARWQSSLASFRSARQPYLLYA